MNQGAQGNGPGRVAAVIPAAGAGVRMGADRPKQFLQLDGRPILEVTLEAFERCPVIGQVLVVVPGEAVAACEARILGRSDFTKVRRILAGGPRRQDSVRMGVEACPAGCRLVVVHDGVRPLVRPELIERTVVEAGRCGAAVAALPATETVKEVLEGNRVYRTLDRGSLWMVQTPQTFCLKDLLEAHRRAEAEGWDEAPDDASLLERLGRPVRVVLGEEDNIKVTTPHDLAVAGFLLKRHRQGHKERRTGSDPG